MTTGRRIEAAIAVLSRGITKEAIADYCETFNIYVLRHSACANISREIIAAADAVDTEKQELIEALRFYADEEIYKTHQVAQYAAAIKGIAPAKSYQNMECNHDQYSQTAQSYWPARG